MNLFFVGSTVLLIATLVLLLPPLLRHRSRPCDGIQRDQLNLSLLKSQLQELDADLHAGRIEPGAHALAREELQCRVMEEVQPVPARQESAESRWPGIAVGIMVPVLAAVLYVLTGTPSALVPEDAAKHELASSEVEAMVSGLADRLKQNPENPEGWRMLARSYNVLGRYREAGAAYEELLRRVPNDAQVYADYADTLAMAQGKTLVGPPERLLEKALAIDATNLKALALAGSAAFEKGDFSRAVLVWEKIMQVAPADSDVARSTSESIDHARRLIKEQAGKSPGAGSAQ